MAAATAAPDGPEEGSRPAVSPYTNKTVTERTHRVKIKLGSGGLDFCPDFQIKHLLLRT